MEIILPRLYVLNIDWPVLHEMVILTGDCFFAQIILPERWTEGIRSPRNSAVLVPWINSGQDWYSLQNTQLFGRAPQDTGQL